MPLDTSDHPIIDVNGRMVRDIEFLQSRMSKLEGSAEFSQDILGIVNNKPVAQEKDISPPFAEPNVASNTQTEKLSEEPSAEKF